MALSDMSAPLQAAVVGSLQQAIDATEGAIPTKVLNKFKRSGLSVIGTLIVRAEQDMTFDEDEIDNIASSYFDALFKGFSDDSIDLLNPRDGSVTNVSFSATAPTGYAARYKDKGGRAISAIDLVRLLNAGLSKYMRLVMNPGGVMENTLTNRTGRFANSAAVTAITPSKAVYDAGIDASRGTTSFAFRYMMRPYSVFDPSVSSYKGLSSNSRNPRNIIAKAIEESLRDILHSSVFSYEMFKYRQE